MPLPPSLVCEYLQFYQIIMARYLYDGCLLFFMKKGKYIFHKCTLSNIKLYPLRTIYSLHVQGPIVHIPKILAKSIRIMLETSNIKTAHFNHCAAVNPLPPYTVHCTQGI
jgi:hypothetical protein